MKTLCFILGILLVLASLLAPWIDSPVGRDVNGLRLSALGEATAARGVGAYALATGLLVVLAVVARRQAADRLQCWLAVALLLVALCVPLGIAFGHPDRLRTLASENEQYRKILEFSTAYLPLNRGTEPTFWPKLDLSNAWSRFVSAWYFVSVGWYVLVTGAAIMLGAGLAYLPRAKMRWNFIAQGFLATAIVTALFVVAPLRAQRSINRALLLRAEGKLEDAISSFEAAMARDVWWQLGPEVPRQIGELHEILGRKDTGEYQLYAGYQLERQNHVPAALFAYQQAADTPATHKIGQREAARLKIEEGLRFYRNGVFDAAISSWRDAIRGDARQLQAFYYIARAQYDVANYPAAIEANILLLTRVSSKIVQANLHSNLGDCYQKQELFAEARAEYDRSKTLDSAQNFRSWMGLVGR